VTGFRGHHAFLAGLVGGLALDQETLVVLAIGFGLGFFAHAIAGGAAVVWRFVRDRFESARPYDYENDPRKPW